MPHLTAHSESVTPPVDLPELPPTVLAALLLVAIPVLEQLGLEHPSASAAIKALGVGRSRAYMLRERLAERLGELLKPTGRPPKAGPEPVPSPQLATTLLGYLYGNPGAVSGSARRRAYSRDFQLFVLEKLVDTHPELGHEAIARSIAVPLPTLNEWMRGERPAPMSDAEFKPEAQVSPLTAREAQVSTILEEFGRWQGAFTAFCDHIQKNLHFPFKRTAISTILDAHGVRRPKRRPGRSPDEDALRDSFETFFPNAQWVGDGSELSIVINDKRHTANLELLVDPYSGAFVGANLRPTEDAAAVVAAFEDAREATKATPITVLLDNKPSNHAPEVIDAVAPAVVMRPTPFRPQNKAHIEGGFGLLKPTLGELNITASTPKEFALALLTLAVIVWGRTINHRPRRDRGGRSRADLLQDTPTSDEIARAKERLTDILRRHMLARQTLAARQDPVVRAYVADALARLHLDDPTGHFITAIASYPLDAIVEAVAIFGGRTAGQISARHSRRPIPLGHHFEHCQGPRGVGHHGRPVGRASSGQRPYPAPPRTPAREHRHEHPTPKRPHRCLYRLRGHRTLAVRESLLAACCCNGHQIHAQRRPPAPLSTRRTPRPGDLQSTKP